MDDEAMTPPSEVRDYFADELRQAEVDFPQFTLASPTGSTARRRWVIAGLGAIVLVAVVAVRSLSTPSGTPGSPAVSPGPSVQALASSLPTALPIGPDGFPLAIDGEPVLRGPAIAAQVASATDSSSFLIGGDTAAIVPACGPQLKSPLTTPLSPLLSSCGGFWVLESQGVTSPRLVLEPTVPSWREGASIVLRVHVHDPRASECPATYRTECERAIVVDSVAWTAPAVAPGPSSPAAVTTLPLDYPTRSCVGGPKLAVLELADGPAFWTAFPNAGKAPELTTVATPLIAVVYADGWPGQTVGLHATRETPAPGTWDVCVETVDHSRAIADSSFIVYGSIPSAGSFVAGH